MKDLIFGKEMLLNKCTKRMICYWIIYDMLSVSQKHGLICPFQAPVAVCLWRVSFITELTEITFTLVLKFSGRKQCGMNMTDVP